MAQYKVLQRWRNKETKEVYTADQVIEMTVKRADEAINNLKEYDGEFLERIDNKEPETNPTPEPEPEHAKEEVPEDEQGEQEDVPEDGQEDGEGE